MGSTGKQSGDMQFFDRPPEEDLLRRQAWAPDGMTTGVRRTTVDRKAITVELDLGVPEFATAEREPTVDRKAITVELDLGVPEFATAEREPTVRLRLSGKNRGGPGTAKPETPAAETPGKEAANGDAPPPQRPSREERVTPLDLPPDAGRRRRLAKCVP